MASQKLAELLLQKESLDMDGYSSNCRDKICEFLIEVEKELNAIEKMELSIIQMIKLKSTGYRINIVNKKTGKAQLFTLRFP
jgi:hypothetical protein